MMTDQTVFFRLSFTKGHFPKLAECAHFHYENVDFGTLQVKFHCQQNQFRLIKVQFKFSIRAALLLSELK